MDSRTCNKIRVTQLRNARDRYMRQARSLKRWIAQAQADGAGSSITFPRRLEFVKAVTAARCTNRSILMWRRLYEI